MTDWNPTDDEFDPADYLPYEPNNTRWTDTRRLFEGCDESGEVDLLVELPTGKLVAKRIDERPHLGDPLVIDTVSYAIKRMAVKDRDEPTEHYRIEVTRE